MILMNLVLSQHLKRVELMRNSHNQQTRESKGLDLSIDHKQRLEITNYNIDKNYNRPF